jgi:hypothetical protein
MHLLRSRHFNPLFATFQYISSLLRDRAMTIPWSCYLINKLKQQLHVSFLAVVSPSVSTGGSTMPSTKATPSVAALHPTTAS